MWSRIALILTTGVLAAGTARAMTPRIGWELSIAYSSFAHVDDREPFVHEWRWVPRTAVVASFELAARVRLSPMLEYVERGQRTTADQPQFTQDQKFRERFLALTLQWSRPVFPRLALVAGPELAFLLKGETWGTFTSSAGGRPSEFGRVDYRFDYTDGADRVDLLAKFGLEAEFPVGRHALTLHGRYVLGITEQDRAGIYSSERNIAWTGNVTPFGMSRSRTRAVEFGVGLHW